MSPNNFGPAAQDETLIFGASRPGYPIESSIPPETVAAWIEFMQSQGIKRVCCLLEDKQLDYYAGDLLRQYRDAFGPGNVCHAPIEDYTLPDRELLSQTILPFLEESRQAGEKTVVHCSMGYGRTGLVLAAWLAYSRDLPPGDAFKAAKVPGVWRNPCEAVGWDDRDRKVTSLLKFSRELGRR